MPEKKLPKYLKDNEFMQFMNAVRKGPFRDQLIMNLMGNLGLRASEVANLCVEDIDFESKTLKVVQGKGHKDRVLPIVDENFIMLLKIVIGDRKSGPFILSSRGKPMTREGIYYLVQKYNRMSVNLPPKQLHPHTLRHTFAVRYLRNGGNIRVLQKLLGHSDIRTTMIYLDLVPEELAADMKRVFGKQ